MSISAGIIVLVVLFAIGALLSARAGIRSLQSARSVVFYRTRRARMLAGQQWLVLAFVLFAFTIAFAAFGRPVANQIFPPTLTPIPSVTWTAIPTETPLPPSTNTNVPAATQTSNATLISPPTSSQALPTASQTPPPPVAVSLTFTSPPVATQTPPPTATIPSSTATIDLRAQA